MTDGNYPCVAVTGLGLVSRLGNCEGAWMRLSAGESALPATPDGRSSAELLRAAIRDALTDCADFGRTPQAAALFDPAGPRCGWVLGVSKTDARTWGDAAASPFPWLRPDGSHLLCDHLRATGPRLTPVAACATGVVAVARGVDLIRDGTCDRVICGAADASLHPLILASFARLGVLADPGEDPAACVRPFDADRSGFAVGEGAAAFVLERADLAAPGTVYATVTGSYVTSAAVKLTDVDPTGDPVRRALVGATGGAAPDLIGLHGTATRANDPAEAAGVRAAFPDAFIPAFGSKGATGHLLGAAGAVELAFTLLALRDGVVPPTTNLRRQDPDCGLNLSPHARPMPLGTAAKVSLGFGGTVAAVALRRGDRPASN